MSQNKLKLLYLRDYLLENTDENHTLMRSEIEKGFSKDYHMTFDRKTFYTDIDSLKNYGMEIEYDEEKQGYQVIQRDFELYELQLLVDSVQSSKYITEKIATEITGKLKAIASKHDRKTLERQSYVANRIRNMSNSAFQGTDHIHECINDRKKLSFKYFNYNIMKEKVYRKNGDAYIVTPFALMWNDNNYYLLAYQDGKMKHFRVDKMEHIELLDEDGEGWEEFRKINLSERSTKVFSMYGGREELVSLRFTNSLAGVVIDRFGKDVTMSPENHESFKITVSIEISPQFFGWLCGLGKNVKILEPESVVEEMGEYISSIADMYQIETQLELF